MKIVEHTCHYVVVGRVVVLISTNVGKRGVADVDIVRIQVFKGHSDRSVVMNDCLHKACIEDG